MKEPGFYSKKSALGIPNALILLMLVFFFVPFGFRGARMALQRTENNVKDWLPSDFRETEELAWFAKRFVSEQFIVATWDGCRENDQRFKMFVAKLRAEQIPAEDAEPSSDYFRARMLHRDQFALFVDEDLHFNWGGKNEKWLVDENGQYYYVTPNGSLFRWEGNANMVSAAWRAIQRATGSFKLEGQFVGGFGNPGTDGAPNPFWQNPRLLTAPLFKTIETGPDLVKQLAGEGGTLFNSTEPKAGERDAIGRLTGTMFGPPIPSDFDWTSAKFQEFVSEETLEKLPEDWRSIWELVVQNELDANWDGDLARFQNASPSEQSKVWYEFFDAVGVEEPDRQTCVMLTLTEPARRNLGRVCGRGMLGDPKGRVFQIAEECGISPPAIPSTAPPPFSWLAATPKPDGPVIRMGGPPVDNVAIDEEGTITLVRLIGYSLLLGVVLSWVLLRSLRLMMMVFFVGGVSAIASLGMVWWNGASVDAILLTMPSLVYVLGMAGAIHIVNYYRDAAVSKGMEGAPERAISHAVMPCTLAAVTTAIGLLSLYSSNILPIRKFGLFSAMGVMATLVLLYTFLPSALTIFPPKTRSVKEGGDKAAEGILRFWEAIGRFILKRHWFVNSVCVVVFVCLGFGLLRIKTSVQLLKLFDGQAQIIKDYAWLEGNFGRLVPMELVVRFPESLQRAQTLPDDATEDEERESRRRMTLIERADAVARIQREVQKQFGSDGADIVGQGMSMTTLMRDIPPPWAGTDVRRMAFNGPLHARLNEMLDSDYLAIEPGELNKDAELWRISLRLGALNNVDYGQFVNSLRTVVEPIVASYRCRQIALESILKSNGSGFESEGETKMGGRVLVLGYTDPSSLTEEGFAEQPKLVNWGPNDELSANIDVMRIFAENLDACLTTQSSEIVWNNPDINTFERGGETSERWGEFLKSCKAVVLLHKHPAYNLSFIKKHNPNFIDARKLLAEAKQLPSDSDEPTQPVALSARKGMMDVVYTGVVPVVYKAQRTLLVSLIESVAWAFVLIAVVMTFLLSPARSILAAFHPRNFLQGLGSGALSMIPNVFPVVIIFGFIGWTDKFFGESILVDIGMMMTASVAMGVAVDDTIHFLTWFREGLRRGLDRREAIFVAYKHVAPAMTQTTLIAGLGLSVFALSTFTPTQRFGTLMLTLLLAALVGDLIFLPALLASPLGRIFSMVKPVAKEDCSDSSDDESEHEGELGKGRNEKEGDYKLAPPEEVPKLRATPPIFMQENKKRQSN